MFGGGHGNAAYPPSASFPDGFVGAPAGTPQYPTLFTSSSAIPNGNAQAPYLIRPPWHVAGVDYAVGIDRAVYATDANLKPTGTNAAALISALGSGNVSFSGGVVNVNGTNVVIDGYDFSLLGYGLQIDGVNCTVSNCKFVTNTSSYNPIGGTIPYTLIKCYIDQGGLNGIGGQAAVNAGPVFTAGTVTIKYCYIRNAWAESLQFGNDITPPAGLSFDIRFNLIENAGMGFGITSGSVHGDWVQMSPLSSSQHWPSIKYDFNTWLQFAPYGTVGSTGARTQGITFAPSVGIIGDTTMNNNTVLGTINGFVSFFAYVTPESVSGTQTVKDNYIDLSCPNLGSQAWLNVVNDGEGFTNTPVISGNLNMVSGQIMVLNQFPPPYY